MSERETLYRAAVKMMLRYGLFEIEDDFSDEVAEVVRDVVEEDAIVDMIVDAILDSFDADDDESPLPETWDVPDAPPDGLA